MYSGPGCVLLPLTALWVHIRTEMLPEKPVRGIASVSDVVEKHVQLLVIVKVGSDDCANR